MEPVSEPSHAPLGRDDLHIEITARLAQLVAAAEPGTRLPTERRLSEMLGVGRSSVREAIRSLAFIGAVHARQGSGTYVSGSGNGAVDRLLGLGLMVQRSKVHEVIEARRLLEVEAVRLAALRHTDEDRAQLTAVMGSMRAALGDPAAAARCDLEYHVLLARASHNSVIVHFVDGMRMLFGIWMKTGTDKRSIVGELVAEHDAVLEAVFARDPDLAARRLAEHLDAAAERLLEDIGRDQRMSDFVTSLLGATV